MAEDKESGVVQITHKQLVTALLVVLFGSNTTGLLNAFNPNVRADAFTMTDWLNGKAEIKAEHEEHEHETSRQILELQFNQGECLRILRRDQDYYYNNEERK